MLKSLLRRSPWASVAAACGIAALALALQSLIDPWTDNRAPFLFFAPALMVAAAMFGRGAAVIVLLAGAIKYALRMPPVGSVRIESPEAIATVIIYLAVGTILILIGGRLRIVNRRAALAEQRLQLAQDDTGVGLFELDYAAGTAFVSPSLCDVLGRAPMQAPMPLAQWLAMLDPAHVEESRRSIEAHLARGELRYEREQRIERPDGTVRWLLTRVHLHTGPTGQLRLARGASVDITDRKRLGVLLRRSRAARAAALSERDRVRAAAAENERRFSVALESSAVPFAILQPVRDGDGQIQDFAWDYANRAALAVLNREATALIGHAVGAQFPVAWQSPELLPRLKRVVNGEGTQEFDALLGPVRWFHVVASPLRDGVAVWFADISERKRQEGWLREADRRKDEFLAILAHELRNPLAPIRQAARVLCAPAASAAQKETCQAIIERQVQHMSLLLDDLLDASRITRGTLLLRKEPVPLQTVVEAALETARPHIEAKQHRLAVDLPQDPPVVELDALRIAQVISNLLTNAAKHTDPEGTIRLSAAVEPEELCIKIADNGIGMSPDQIDRLFAMFSQLPSGSGRSQGGLGIGLALSRALVEMHGGRIEAASAGPGGGSEFTVRLPRVA
jgi:PAS domain S-box-containing protein